MSFHTIFRIPEHSRRADKSAVIGINLSWEVRQEARRSVGARVVDERLGAAFIALMVARSREAIMFLQAMSPGEQDAGDPKGPLLISTEAVIRLFLAPVPPPTALP